MPAMPAMPPATRPPARRGLLRAAAASAIAATVAGCASGPARLPGRSHFVLVHGAWHGAWCWNRLAPLLRAQGHMVTTLDLPGRWGTPEQLAALTPADYVAAITQVLDTAPEPVVLLGHSLGGGSISLAAEARPAQVRTLVYLTAFLVPAGQSMGAIGMADTLSLTGTAVRRDPRTGVSTLDPDRVREVFYQDCSADDLRIARQLVTPESAAMPRAPIQTTAERFGRIDRAYIECTQDHAISLAAQRRMQAALPCRRTLALDSGHSPFLSQPQRLADALASLV